ncbi:MAG: trigger factor [Patescibacteria group bacterium]
MNIKKTNLTKSQVELKVELSIDEFNYYIKKATESISNEMEIKGFRKGKISYDILKQKIGEMTILEKAANIAIDKTIEVVVKKNVDGCIVDQPRVDIIKLAPNNPMEYKIVVSVLSEMNIGNYKDIKIKRPTDIEVSDKDVMVAIEKMREMRAKESIADREIKDEDKVIVDIDMFLDNVPIEGGQSKDLAVIVGKNYFVPGFSKKLIKAKKSNVIDFNLPYPQDHYQSNLAGKLVNFKVKIKEIYERKMEDVNDNFAKTFNFKNLEDLKNNIKQNIKQEKSLGAEQKIEIEILNKILEKTKFSDIPEILISRETQNMIADLEQSIKTQGGKFDDYLLSIHKTQDQLALDLLPEALKRVKTYFIIREVARLENIEVSKKEIDLLIQDMLAQLNAFKRHKEREELKKQSKDPRYRAYMHNSMVNTKVIDKLRKYATGR